MPAQENFRPEPHSARAVRVFVAEELSGSSHLEDIVLAASELATNVIRHARTPFTVRLVGEEERVRLEVADGSSIVPPIRDISESRRGLPMVESLSEDWGVEPREDGKVVWAEFVVG